MPRIRPCLAVEQVVASEAPHCGLDGEARVPLVGEAGALLDGQGGPTVDPYGGGADPAIPISSDRFLRLNIGEFSGINLRAEPLCLHSEWQKRLWFASPHNDGGVVNV